VAGNYRQPARHLSRAATLFLQDRWCGHEKHEKKKKKKKKIISLARLGPAVIRPFCAGRSFMLSSLH